jgi:peptidoglycan DL-endopeptidase CwlO
VWKERVTSVRAHPGPNHSRLRRAAVTAAGLVLAGALAGYGGAAIAAPGPTAGQLQQRISKLMSKLDAVAQQYDQSVTELKAASKRLGVVNRELATNQARFEQMRAAMAQIASAAYEQGSLTSASELLASDNPQQVLDQASLLNHLSRDRGVQLAAFLNVTRALRTAQQAHMRTRAAIALLEKTRAAQRRYLKKLVAKNQAELNKLTAPPTSGTSGASGGGITYTGPATGAARTAISFALAQVGKPYQWGATGPGAFDCSGLVQAAWAAAGVSIPRTTYDMWAALPHVPASSVRPGDLAFFDGEGHVAMYIGGGKYVDAPQTGENVEVIPTSTSWYASTLDGFARP